MFLKKLYGRRLGLYFLPKPLQDEIYAVVRRIIDIHLLERLVFRLHNLGLRAFGRMFLLYRAERALLGTDRHILVHETYGFGAAQRIYIKRGYIPDGSGIWYRDKLCVPYEDAYLIDDELVLYLSKKLK